ncbi:MAG TPA: TonB-dependent receptor plug domain-containing protein, partial [Chitinophagaceae bacterium]|nr:TonB-dependent receptor plug domain-containing protein [Chitinophagaceae bacterium]
MAAAQTVRVQVILKGPAGDSLSNATIEVYTLPDSLLLQSHLSQGPPVVFMLKPNARYRINASAVGFETTGKTISAAGRSMAVTLELRLKNTSLATVTVVSKKPLLKQEDDKTIVDATELANSSTNGYEVLEKTPGVVVDQDGNVYLNSTTPATVYINGREMRMSTEDIAALLKSLPAGAISRIEILRTPSARYDAANSGGIVNVVLKKGVKTGTTGSVNVRFDQGVYATPSAGFSINKSAGKINSYISYQYTGRRYYEDIESKRRTGADTLLDQNSATKYMANTHYIGGGLDIALSKKFNIAYDGRLTNTANDNHAGSTNEFSHAGTQSDFFQSQTAIGNKGNNLFSGNTLSSKLKLDSSGSEWVNEISYTWTKNTNTQLYTTDYLLPPAPTLNG